MAKTAEGNYTLGLFDIDAEQYTTLRECLSELNRNLRQFKENNKITIHGEQYNVKFLLGGDMSFLHTAMGLNACHSNNSCILCKAVASTFHQTTTELRQEDKRTIQDLRDKLHCKNQEGYKNEPIFDFIEFEDVVFDTLHLLLRVAGNLTLNFIYLPNENFKLKFFLVFNA